MPPGAAAAAEEAEEVEATPPAVGSPAAGAGDALTPPGGGGGRRLIAAEEPAAEEETPPPPPPASTFNDDGDLRCRLLLLSGVTPAEAAGRSLPLPLPLLSGEKPTSPGDPAAALAWASGVSLEPGSAWAEEAGDPIDSSGSGSLQTAPQTKVMEWNKRSKYRGKTGGRGAGDAQPESGLVAEWVSTGTGWSLAFACLPFLLSTIGRRFAYSIYSIEANCPSKNSRALHTPAQWRCCTVLSREVPERSEPLVGSLGPRPVPLEGSAPNNGAVGAHST